MNWWVLSQDFVKGPLLGFRDLAPCWFSSLAVIFDLLHRHLFFLSTFLHFAVSQCFFLVLVSYSTHSLWGISSTLLLATPVCWTPKLYLQPWPLPWISSSNIQTSISHLSFVSCKCLKTNISNTEASVFISRSASSLNLSLEVTPILFVTKASVSL